MSKTLQYDKMNRNMKAWTPQNIRTIDTVLNATGKPNTRYCPRNYTKPTEKQLKYIEFLQEKVKEAGGHYTIQPPTTNREAGWRIKYLLQQAWKSGVRDVSRRGALEYDRPF